MVRVREDIVRLEVVVDVWFEVVEMLFKGNGTARGRCLRQRGVGSDGDGVEEGGFHEHSVTGGREWEE